MHLKQQVQRIEYGVAQLVGGVDVVHTPLLAHKKGST